MRVTIYLIICLVSLVKISNSARILCVASVPSYSHHVLYNKLWLALAKRGHDLVLLTTDVIPNAPKNIKQIDWKATYDIRHKKYNISQVQLDHKYNIFKLYQIFGDMLNDVIHEEMTHPDVVAMLQNKTEYFDVVIVESTLSPMYGFAVHYNCPFIGIASSDLRNDLLELLGNPAHHLLHSSFLVTGDGTLSFKDRTIGFTMHVLSHLTAIILNFGGNFNEMTKQYFGDDMPDLNDLTKNMSLFFLNIHPVFNARALVPGVIRIGGISDMGPAKPLPNAIKSFLDGDQGVIYFSLGTNVKSDNIKDDFLNVILKTFKELPFKVLWKFEIDIPEAPKNVKIMKWLPQPDILQHKNIKLFITQGGVQSIDESIYSHIPMLVIPFISDQKANAYKIVRRKLGLTLNKNDITKEKLLETVFELINNPSYKENVKRTASYLMDQPMSGIDTAVWWTEYVLRHKGAHHLWDHSKTLPFYQYFMLDVIAFLLISFYMLFRIVSVGLKYVFGCFKKQKTD